MTTIKPLVYNWIADLHADTDPNTGYLVKKPTGFYGKRVKELVKYSTGLSVEMKAIQHSRQMRVHPCRQYAFYVFEFLSDMILPVTFAVMISYWYYQWTPDYTPVVANATVAEEWSVRAAGEWVGTSLRSVITVPINFMASAVDRGFHVEEISNYFQTTGTKMMLLPFLFIAVYGVTKLLGRLLIHMSTLCSAHNRVWFLQNLLIKETEEALERAIVGRVKPFLMLEYEKLLNRPDYKGLYMNNLPIVRLNLVEQVSAEIKSTPFAELVKEGHLSALYAQTIHGLIRHADDGLSNTLFEFHEEIHRIPDRIQGIGNQAYGRGRQALTMG